MVKLSVFAILALSVLAPFTLAQSKTSSAASSATPAPAKNPAEPAKNPPAPENNGTSPVLTFNDVTPQCISSFDALQQNSCYKKMSSGESKVTKDITFDQYLQFVTENTKSICTSECSTQANEAAENIRKSCSAPTDQGMLFFSTFVPFTQDLTCAKAKDGQFCSLRMLEPYRANKELDSKEILKVFTSDDPNYTIPIEKLPKEVVCGECFKQFTEQSGAFAQKYPNDPFEPTNGTDPKAASEQIKKTYDTYIQQIEAKCGASGFIDRQAPLSFGTGPNGEVVRTSDAHSISTSIVSLVSVVGAGFVLLL